MSESGGDGATAAGEEHDASGQEEDLLADGRRLRERIVAQFSGRGERADVWRGFARFLPTGKYLNLGYSPPYLPHAVGSSQRRLARYVRRGMTDRADPAGTRLLDLGCGRGGPALEFADGGFDVFGVDLVPHNVALARTNARRRDEPAEFAVGDAAALPFEAGAFEACVSLDALVYVPETTQVFAEVARVLAPGGFLGVADLLARDGTPPEGRAAIGAFADAWDMAPPPTLPEYRTALSEAGLAVEAVEDVTPNSTGRFRTWSGAFLALARGPAGGAVRRLLRRWELDPDRVIDAVAAAHEALPHLRHVVVYARRPE